MSEHLRVYPGQSLDVTWDERLCIHIGECGRARGDMFEAGRDPWCAPDLTSPDGAVDVIGRCPTGALAYTPKGDIAPESAPAENRVFVANHGPLYVSGDLSVDGAADDMDGARFRVALCRCGKSANKPFCDNSHEEEGFRDRGAVGESGDATAESGGALEVGRAPNGPLLLKGSFAIISSSGRVAWRGKRAALCRCGESQNKPFCDGAHKAAGFEAE